MGSRVRISTHYTATIKAPGLLCRRNERTMPIDNRRKAKNTASAGEVGWYALGTGYRNVGIGVYRKWTVARGMIRERRNDKLWEVVTAKTYAKTTQIQPN